MVRKIVFAALAVIVLVIAASIGSAQVACAHDPRFACSPRESNPVAIADASKSWAFYGHLRPGQTDVYRFTTSRSMDVPWNVLLDRRDESNPARPSAVMADANGRIVAQVNLNHAVAFYEPFSREHYLQSPDRILRLTPGRYEIRVTMSSGRNVQRYTMAVGLAERFSPLEFPYLVGAVFRIRAQRY